MATGWYKVEAGHYAKRVSLTGTYHAEKDQDRRYSRWGWALRYEGADSRHVHWFDTLAEAKAYVEGHSRRKHR